MADQREIHYRGNVAADLPGRIMGPDAWGAFVVITNATFDPEADATTATWRPCLPAELGERIYDGFSQMWFYDLCTAAQQAALDVQLGRVPA